MPDIPDKTEEAERSGGEGRAEIPKKPTSPEKPERPAKKAAAPRKAAPPRKSVPAAKKAVTAVERKSETATVIPIAPVQAPAPDPVERFESLTEELLAEPSRTPEILATAAVRTFGPRASAWAARTRAAYPTASAEALARLAVHRFTRTAEIRAAVGALTGPYTPIAVTGGVLVSHAELVLHLAAAFGVDPEDPGRAEDLLKLASPGPGPVVTWLAVGLINRRLPGVSVLSAVLGARSTTEAVAVRARRFYRKNS